MRKKDKKQLQEEKDLMILASEETTDFRGISRETGFSYTKVMKLKKELSEQELNKILANFKENKKTKKSTKNTSKKGNQNSFNELAKKVLEMAKTGQYSSLGKIAKELEIPQTTLGYRIKQTSLHDEIMENLHNKQNPLQVQVKNNKKKEKNEEKEKEIILEEIKLHAERVKITAENKELEYISPIDSVIIDTSVMGIGNITEILNKMLKKNIKICVIDPVLVELDCLSKDKEDFNTAMKAKNLIRYIFMHMSRIVFFNVKKETSVDETVIVTARRTKSLLMSADMVQCLRAGIQGVDFRAYVLQDKDVTYMQYCKNKKE